MFHFAERTSTDAALPCKCLSENDADKCDSFRPTNNAVQRLAIGRTGGGLAPAIVHDEIRSSGEPMKDSIRRPMESRLGHDFSHVRVHTGERAAASARAIDAHAYTVGPDIVFGAGQYAPHTSVGQKLLAHELAHVSQQRNAQPTSHLRIEPATSRSERDADAAADTVVGGGRKGAAPQASPQRESSGLAVDAGLSASHAVQFVARAPTTLGTKFSHPAGKASTFKNVHATFDGADFTVFDGSTSLLTHAAQSGRPVSVRPSDAGTCGGSTAESYLNNPRYVGISDFGPIPEGDFVFNLNTFATFSGLEQLQMISGGMYTDPFGTPLHGGDWGSGRAPLRPVRILPGPKGCGHTGTRSGFYLHGGSLPGSSGCIDVDNDGIDALLKLLVGYKKDILVKVRYTNAAPAVGWGTRRVGGFTYPTDDQGHPIKDPSIWDRIKGAAKD